MRSGASPQARQVTLPVVVIFIRGAGWDAAEALGRQSGIAEHAAFIHRLMERGVVVHAGPLHHLGEVVTEEVVGLAILSGFEEEVGELIAQDPAVQVGTLDFRFYEWHVSGFAGP